jgi:CheY-like chemotaxis protein/predicted  nucleic acid-binding Zn-ribbon protein
MSDNKAENSKKQQQDFLASIAHELRTPLNGIIGLSDALFKSEQNKGRAKHLKMIFSCANRLVGLVNMIMDITALRDGKLNLNVTDSMSFNEICEEVQELMINAVDKNGKKIKKDSVDLQIDLDASVPSMQGDKERLTQVVYNLVNNALKFTESGFVKLSTKFDQGTLLFCCSDSGKGIKKENFKKIFEAFGQEEEGKGGGLGLGLAIVTKILDLHGGTIWVESELGKGAQFYVRCPLKMDPNALAAIKAEAEAKQAVAEAAAQGSSAQPTSDAAHHAHGDGENKSLAEEARAKLTTNPVKIMVVDGDQSRLDQMVKVMSSHPERPNTQVIALTDGMKALQQIDSTNLPDLVILDADTPGGMSPFDVLNTLRSEQTPDLNIMVVCAAGDTTKQLRATQALASSVTFRPWTDEVFGSLVHEILLMQTMVKMDRETKIGGELMTRLLPASIVAKMGKGGTGLSLVAENYKQVTVATIQIREFDQIVALLPITQVAVLLNRVQASIDSCLNQFDVVRLDAVGNCGEFVVMSGHDRQEDHVDKVMGFAKKVLSLVGNGNLKIAGHAVELLVGVHTGPAVACVLSGTTPRYLVFSEACDLSKKLCITGAGNYVHVSKIVADRMNEEYEGSGLFDFVERGTLGDGEFAVSTFALKNSSEESGDGLKNATLNSTLSQVLEGSGPGSCAGSSGMKDQLEDYERKVQMLDMRLSIMRGLDEAGNAALKQLETAVLKSGAIPASALLAITDPIEQTLSALDRVLGPGGSDTPSKNIVSEEIARLELEAEELVCEIESLQKTAREAKKQVHQAIATATVGTRSGKQIGITDQGSESMGIVLDEMMTMMDTIDKKLADGGYPPPNNGDLSKILTDLTIEVEAISTNIDRAIRAAGDSQSISSGDLAQLKGMSEQVQNLKIEIAKKDALLAGMPINGGIPKDEAIAMLQELMAVQQECRTLHLEVEWYQEKIAELSGTNSKLLEDNKLLANDIREAKNILDEQERTIRHQQLQLSQASSMNEFAAPSVSGYYRPYSGGSARGMSLPPNRLGLLRAPGPGAGQGLAHWAQMAGFNFGQGFQVPSGGVML